ncbi:MAG: hypothetical protein KAI81_00250 [Candidatus Marinimicrobia bacterium]|nr:hypothetical protein [Candidatus Neomarinimicrobiota bacterium]
MIELDDKCSRTLNEARSNPEISIKSEIADKYSEYLKDIVDKKTSPMTILESINDSVDKENFAELLLALNRDKLSNLDNDMFENILATFAGTEKRLTILREFYTVFPSDIIFEKLAPHIEHFPDLSKDILKYLLVNNSEDTIKFLADLAVVSYPFADELFNELKIWYRNNTESYSKEKDHFDSAWKEIQAIRKDRILLFPEVVD